MTQLRTGLIGVVAAFLLGAVVLPAFADGTCGQPLSTGTKPTVKDCIYIARASLGAVPCSECVCDTDGSGAIRLGDALRCLISAIGGKVTLECPPCEATSTTTTVPTCATCSQVALGGASADDLCESSRVLYDAMTSCPCDSCSAQCPRMCSDSTTSGGFACLRCLKESCSQAFIDCLSD